MKPHNLYRMLYRYTSTSYFKNRSDPSKNISNFYYKYYTTNINYSVVKPKHFYFPFGFRNCLSLLIEDFASSRIRNE